MVGALSRKTGRLALAGTLTLLPLATTLQAQAPDKSNGSEATAVVTATTKGGEAPPVPQQQIQVSVDGKKVEPSVWKPYANGPVQMVVLIDNSARTSLGRNLSELEQYINNLPPNVAIGVAYMQNGAAIFTGPMSTDHASAAKQVHLPGGSAGSNASPYFCLSDLAKRWPAPRSEARRVVLMITDGVDEYNLRYDPEDPYVRSAVLDSERAGLVVYSIYFRDQGRLGRGFYETNAGQNYLTQVAVETGGNFYYEGLSNPVSFNPFLTDLTRRLSSQYELDFPVKADKKESYPSLKVKSEVKSVKIDAPQHVAVSGGQ
jgi:hypothetical protein